MGEKVRVDGEVPIPKKSLTDLFSRIDDLLELLLKVESAQLQVLKALAGVVPDEEIVTKVEIAKSNRYQVVTLDLGTARTDVAVGLKEKNRVANFLSWELVEAATTYKLNSKGNDSMAASVGVEHENFEIEEIYITNAAAAGMEARLYYEWRQD